MPPLAAGGTPGVLALKVNEPVPMLEIVVALDSVDFLQVIVVEFTPEVASVAVQLIVQLLIGARPVVPTALPAAIQFAPLTTAHPVALIEVLGIVPS